MEKCYRILCGTLWATPPSVRDPIGRVWTFARNVIIVLKSENGKMKI
jgi:hypothetical protein